MRRFCVDEVEEREVFHKGYQKEVKRVERGVGRKCDINGW